MVRAVKAEISTRIMEGVKEVGKVQVYKVKCVEFHSRKQTIFENALRSMRGINSSSNRAYSEYLLPICA